MLILMATVVSLMEMAPGIFDDIRNAVIRGGDADMCGAGAERNRGV